MAAYGTTASNDPFLLAPEGGAPGSKFVADANKEVRLGFVRKVYGILSVQLLLTAGIATPIYLAGEQWILENQWMLVLSMAALFATMCAMCCCAPALKTFPTNYLFLLLITVAMSVMVGFSTALYTWQSVLLSAAITGLIFIGMTIYAWTTKTDFTGAGPYLFAAMLALMVFGFVIGILALCGVNVEFLTMLYDLAGILLFTFYIVFDTQLMLGELGGHQISFSIDDYTFAALNLYLDIINLFLHLLSVLGERR